MNQCRDVTSSPVEAIVLNELRSADGLVTWQARIGPDRGRLEVVAVVAPSSLPTVVAPLTDVQLRELLEPARADRPQGSWTCESCRHINDGARRWCSACSAHGGAR